MLFSRFPSEFTCCFPWELGLQIRPFSFVIYYSGSILMEGIQGSPKKMVFFVTLGSYFYLVGFLAVMC